MSVISWIVKQLLELYAMLAAVPFLIFPLVGLAIYAVGKDKKTAIRRSADVTMFFLVGSVSATYDMVFHTELKGIWLVLLLLLLMTGLFGSVQNRMRGRIDPDKLLRTVWRFGFLLLVPFYLLLSIVGMIKTMSSF